LIASIASPAVEAVIAGALSSAYDEADDPECEQDSCKQPQKMDGEAESGDDQDDQQCKDYEHENQSLR
jgi:hypothetical protein